MWKNKTDVSRAIADFEQSGLILRSRETVYKAVITLTEPGKKIAFALAIKAMNAVSLFGENIGPEDMEKFCIMLESIANKLAFLSEKGIPN